MMISSTVNVVSVERSASHFFEFRSRTNTTFAGTGTPCVVLTDSHQHLGQNLGPTATLADIVVQLFQGKRPPFELIFDVFRILEHVDGVHLQGFNPSDDVWKCKPAVKDQMPRRSPCLHGKRNHLHQNVGGFPHALLAALVPAGPLVDTVAHRSKAVLYLGGTEHRQHHGNNAVAVGPPQGEHSETAHRPVL